MTDGFNNDILSEKNKEALKSETWNQARKAMEIKHYTTDKSTIDSAYGATRHEVVFTYLETGYKDEQNQHEVEAFGQKYKVLKRDMITTFYDEAGSTLFDVENERLDQEYDWLMSAPVETKAPIGKTIADIEKQAFENVVANEKTDREGEAEECDSCEKIEKAEEKLVYQTGGQKIKAEAEEQYEKAKGKEPAEMMKAQMAPIIEYITKKCEAEAEYNALVLQPHKNWERCYEFMMDKAQKMVASGSTGLLVEGTTVLKWIDEYYQLDDKAQVEKEVAEKAKKKNGTKGNSVKGKSQKPTACEPKADGKKEVPACNQKTGKKKNEIDGQFSLFDMM